MQIGDLTATHWDSLMTDAKLIAWVEARRMGLTVEQCDRITTAAVVVVRKKLQGWDGQPQSAEEPRT